jgi:hypothetical protein
MTETDRKQFFSLIANVCAFYRQDFSEFLGTVWWNAMRPFDFSAVGDAINRHCVNPDGGQFMPKPADVVRMLQGSSQDRALTAWAKVDRALRSIGPHASVVFDDSLIHRVLTEMGGWISLGGKLEKEWPFVAKEFESRYRGYMLRGEVPEYPPSLVGIADASNEQRNFPAAPPVLIGDGAKARQVLLGGVDKLAFERVQAHEIAALARPVRRLEAA